MRVFSEGTELTKRVVLPLGDRADGVDGVDQKVVGVVVIGGGVAIRIGAGAASPGWVVAVAGAIGGPDRFDLRCARWAVRVIQCGL